jgi:hypothetical protein
VPVLVGHGRRIYADSLVFTIGPKLKPNASASKSQFPRLSLAEVERCDLFWRQHFE